MFGGLFNQVGPEPLGIEVLQKTKWTQTPITSLEARGKKSVEVQTESITTPHQPLPKLAYYQKLAIVERAAEGSGSSVFSSRLRGFGIQGAKEQEDIYRANLKYIPSCVNVIPRARNYSIVIRDLNNVVILKTLSFCVGVKMVISDADDKVIAKIQRKFMPPAYKVRSAIGLSLFTFRRDGPGAYNILSSDELLLGSVLRQDRLHGGGPPDKFFHPKLYINFTQLCDMRLRALIVCASLHVVISEEPRT